MNDLFQAKVRCLQNNIDRYCRLLATELTDIEREYIHRQIARERSDLEVLLRSKKRERRGLDAYATRQAIGRADRVTTARQRSTGEAPMCS